MILVTGATGLVGAHLLFKLVQNGKSVRALYRSEDKKQHVQKMFFNLFGNRSNKLLEKIEWQRATINDIPALSAAFIGITEVYHCAAIISFNPALDKQLRKVNIEGTANIVNLSILNKVRKICYVSSIAALGEPKGKSKINEASEWNPESNHSIYAITKYGGEMEVWRGTQEGLRAIIVNPGIIIGPGFFNSGSGFLFKKIYKGLRFYTPGITGYVSVHDVTNVMFELMESQHTNERYVLVSENLSFKHIFTLIANSLHVKPPTTPVAPFAMKLAAQLQWLGYKLFGISPTIYNASVQSAFSTSLYENTKVKKVIKFEFTPIKKAVEETAKAFLKG
ncbi:NAD-dependent epimerase/dehydratase family protein [Aquimarina sp. W85]|uniref:NAD-dependent epimerase/dehydratase family protein n=1 Tax=Aquimarina rhodophyticola TaxID=3342246 RepID=UPI0036711844